MRWGKTHAEREETYRRREFEWRPAVALVPHKCQTSVGSCGKWVWLERIWVRGMWGIERRFQCNSCHYNTLPPPVVCNMGKIHP